MIDAAAAENIQNLCEIRNYLNCLQEVATDIPFFSATLQTIFQQERKHFIV